MRNREGRLENEFEQDRQRMDREERQRAKDDEREYQRRLKEVERYEEKLMQQRRKRRRQEDDDIRERQALIKQVRPPCALRTMRAAAALAIV